MLKEWSRLTCEVNVESGSEVVLPICMHVCLE